MILDLSTLLFLLTHKVNSIDITRFTRLLMEAKTHISAQAKIS